MVIKLYLNCFNFHEKSNTVDVKTNRVTLDYAVRHKTCNGI